MGTCTLRLLEEADDCPIFSGFPKTFEAQLGHKDHVVELPEGALNLITSENSVIQAYTFKGEPVYGLTFHPELNEEAMIWRIVQYANEYHVSKEELVSLKEVIKETPYASKVLTRFMEEVVKKKRRYR